MIGQGASDVVGLALVAALQQLGVDLAAAFEETLAQLVASYGRLPVSAAILVFAAVVGAVVVPWTVALCHAVADRLPLGGGAHSLATAIVDLVPTSFSELLVRIVQLTVAILAALALVVVWGYAGLASDLRATFASDIQDVIGLSITLVLIALAFVGSDALQRVVERLGDEADDVTKHQQEIVLRVGQVALLLTLGAAILTLWSFDLSGLLVGAGFLGIVIGFGARKTLGSMIAGFMLMFSRPFEVGDWVEIGDSEGLITDITMFNTRMQNVDAELLVIPNDIVSDSTVVNRSRKGRLRLRREVGIDYDADLEHAREVAVEAMKGVDPVLDSPDPAAVPIRFEDSAIVLELRFWIADPHPSRKWDAIAGVTSAVTEAFEREGITIPFPQRTLSQRGDRDGGEDGTDDASENGDAITGADNNGNDESGHSGS